MKIHALLIKGTYTESTKILKEKVPTGTRVELIKGNKKYNTVHFEATANLGDEHILHNILVKWFSETGDHSIIKGYGYPAGSLLWFSVKEIIS